MTIAPRWIGIVTLAAVLWAQRAGAQTTANPHGGAVGTCSDCHLPTAWRPVRVSASFRHAERTFPLDGAHTTAACTACHTSLVFADAPTRCAACHQDVHRGELGVNCARCHTTRSFVDQARLARLHEETRFPLRGAHVATSCESCHPATAAGQPQFAGRPTTCVGCHRTDYDRAAKPPHAGAGFPTTCVTCHTETAWRGAPFDHNTTQFPLTGAHQAATCTSCHSDGVYRGKPTTCVSCHRPDYAKTTTPPHAAAAFATTCTSCHTTTRWQGAVFDHNTTQFPLTGGHQAVACASCHGDGVYHGKSTNCVTCHRADYDKTSTPPHAAAAFSTTCTTCHTGTTTWQGANFNHSTTQFPLTGAHLTASCAACHGDGVYRGKPITCVSCHRPDYDKTTVPAHAAAGYSTDCTTCHTGTATWQGANFNHSTTQFPLTGAHLTVGCASCHADGVFKGKPTACVACHRPDFDKTTAPAHAAAGYSTDCTTCHTTNAWQGANFNHNTTQFPLTGAHGAVACASCHGDGVYKGKPTACVACHRPEYDKTTTPPHAAAAFATTCASCHTTTTWQGAVFNHSTTRFPLIGAHLTASCASCHSDGVYAGKPTACVACHRPEYDRTTNPAHAAAGYSTDCTTCHTGTTTWQGAVFNHSTTQFPLTGAHLAVACSACHSDGVFKGKPTTCVSCHQPQYTATTTPPHAAAGFSTSCATCHNSTTWLTATFDHATTGWALTGVHSATPCASCHRDGVYRGKSTTCASCHQVAYDGTTNPNHRAAFFPTTCESCHTTTTWLGATFDHDGRYFPIYSGAHQGRWTRCADCHTSSNTYTVFTCITCHLQTITDSHHQQVPAYRYQSTSCYSCHPRGKAG